MTSTKILVVAILIVSCIFLYTAATVAGKRDELRTQAIEEAEAATNDKEQAESQLDKKNVDYDHLEKSADGLKATIAELQAECKSKGQDIFRLKNDKSKLETEKGVHLKDYKDAIAESQGKDNDIKTHLLRVAKLQNEIADLKASKHKLEMLKGAHDDVVAKKDAEITGWKKKLNEKARELEDEKKRNRDKDTGTVGDRPDVTCTITHVIHGAKLTMVELDKGKDSKLEPGLELYVYNSAEKFKGTIIITEVHPKKCFARVIEEVAGKKIAANDSATVKNW